MRRLAATLLSLLLSSCGTDVADASAGWGLACPEVPNRLTSCTSLGGEVGWCAVGFCRRRCEATADGFAGCEADEVATPTIDDACYCVPREVP